jgi:subtilisin family serine protease
MLKHIILFTTILTLLSCGGDNVQRKSASVYKEGELLVKYRHATVNTKKDAVHSALGAQVIKTVGRDGLERIRLPHGVSVEEAVQFYMASPDVEYAEPNYIVRACALPNDSQFNALWGLNNTGQIVNGSIGTPDADIDAPEAWDITKGSSSVIVAVIDTGVDANHPDLGGNLLPGYDFVDNDTDPDDLNGHGTHVAGIIGAVGNNANGVTGVNWNVRILPLRVLDQNGEGTIADIIEAIDYAASSSAKIVNLSLSGPDYSISLYNKIASYHQILFVSAAGNGGQDGFGDNNDITPEYPSGFDLDNILSVAATDSNDNLAVFSNYGRASVDVAAPGTDILSTIPSFITAVSYHGAHRVVYFSFGFEGINGASARNTVLQAILNFHAILPGSKILLVDDDGGSFYEPYFIQSLQSLGYTFTTFTVPVNGDGPSAAVMGQYALVIWFTGDQYSNTLTLSDQTNLQSFLDDSGRLFLTGQDIGYDAGTSSFYQNYLHAEYITDDANGKAFTGINSFDGIAIDLSVDSGDGARNQNFIDAIRPLGSSEAFYIRYQDAFQFFRGTSMSTSVVSGIAALVASHYSDFNADQMKSVILSSVDQEQSLQNKIQTGGRVNAYKAITALIPPSALTAQALSTTEVKLTWSDTATGEYGYKIERKTPGGQFVEIGSVTANQTSHTDPGLDPGATYVYRIRAFIETAFSSYSNEASVTLPGGGGNGGRGGGGGGCSIGAVRNAQTAYANAFMLLVPLIVTIMLKRFKR